MTWKPARNSANRSLPMTAMTDRPIAESTEYRPPTQSQKPNMLSVSMPNSSTSFSLVDTATKCLDTRGRRRAFGQPAPGRGGVGQRLQRGERLRRDDEKRCGRVESVEFGDQVGGVDVGDEARRDAGVGVVAQRLVHHHRAEVRAADADVDDGLDALAGRAGPLAGAQPVGEVAHRVEHLVHVGDDVLAVDHQLGAAAAGAARCAARRGPRRC